MADSDLVVGLAEVALHDSSNYEKRLSDSIADDSYGKEIDSVHEGLVFPTDEELLTLRRVSDAIPWTAYRTLPLVQISPFIQLRSDRCR